MKDFLKNKHNWISALYIVLSIVVCFVILQMGCCIDPILSVVDILTYHPTYLLLDIVIISLIYILIYAISGRVKLSSLILNCVAALFSVVNVYVVSFHGDVLSLALLNDVKTAANVAGSYSLTNIHQLQYVFIIAGLLLIIILFSIFWRPKWKPAKAKKRFTLGIFSAVVMVLVYFFLFASDGLLTDEINEARVSEWSISSACREYGYLTILLNSRKDVELTPPDDYSVDNITFDKTDSSKKTYSAPDIILILNESFYDLSDIADFTTNEPYLDEYYNIPDAIYGKAVVERVGGGTNTSEYELLTGNCVNDISTVSPFTALDVSATSSIVSLLNEQGYYTIGAHAQTAANYNRNVGYSDLGFDEIHFLNDFENLENWGNKSYATDESVYDNLINWYTNNAERETPVFSYMLTIQNHGGYDTNDKQYDTIEVSGIDSSMEDEVEEYLSGIKKSSESFAELCDHFKNSDRDVIICMVGDHAPPIVSELVDNEDDINENVALRSVPFCIWANYDLDEDAESNLTTNMSGLVPYLLELANVKTSDYFDYINESRNYFSAYLSNDYYLDDSGEIKSFSEKGSSDQKEVYHNYKCLSYCNMTGDGENDLFHLND